MSIEITLPHSATHIPLFQDHSMPLQIPDKATAKHFLTSENPAKVHITKIIPNFIKITRQQLKTTVPRKELFIQDDSGSHADGMHGVPHESRVGLYVKSIVDRLNLKLEPSRILYASALLHDTQRKDDRLDPQHGKRSADWTKIALKKNPSLLAEHDLFLSDSEIAAVRAVSKYHEMPYEKIPERIKNKYGGLIQLFMVADGLDRFRLPSKEWWPDSKHFSHNPFVQNLFEEMMPFAKFITLKSEHIRTKGNTSTYAALKKVGRKVGIVETPFDEALRHLKTLSYRRYVRLYGV